MPLPPLASVAELEIRLGRALVGDEVARAAALLDDASAAVRSYTGQVISAGTSTVRLRVRGGTVHLPQRPVNDVTAVNDTDGNPVAFTWWFGERALLEGPWTEFVDVTYDHGYAEVPGDIVAVVTQMAGRAFGTSVSDSGLSRERIGTYEYQVGPAAAAGGVGTLNDEKAVLNRYRRVGGTAWLAS